MPAYPLPTSKLFGKLQRAIHPKCEMHSFARTRHDEESAFNYYFYSADYLIQRLVAALSKLGVDPAELSLLDFACGYGRITRSFVHIFKEVVVSDLEQEMLDFNHEHFGAEGFLSTVDPEEISGLAGRRFGVVFCFSLMTHLPLGLWSRWLRTLFEQVEDNGYLIFSTRSMELVELMEGGSSVAVVGGKQESLLQLTPEGDGGTLEVSGLRFSTSSAFSGTIHISCEVTSEDLPRVGEACLMSETPTCLNLGTPSVDLFPSTNHHTVRIRLPISTDGPVEAAQVGRLTLPLEFSNSAEARVSSALKSPAVFTTPESEFQFNASNETLGRLDGQSYGGMAVTDNFVRGVIAKDLPEARIACWLPLGYGDLFQDLYILHRER